MIGSRAASALLTQGRWAVSTVPRRGKALQNWTLPKMEEMGVPHQSHAEVNSTVIRATHSDVSL